MINEYEFDAAPRKHAVLDDNRKTTTLAIPGHALHDKGVQRQIGVGTLVSSKERRAAVVPVINRLATAGFVP